MSRCGPRSATAAGPRRAAVLLWALAAVGALALARTSAAWLVWLTVPAVILRLLMLGPWPRFCLYYLPFVVALAIQGLASTLSLAVKRVAWRPVLLATAVAAWCTAQARYILPMLETLHGGRAPVEQALAGVAERYAPADTVVVTSPGLVSRLVRFYAEQRGVRHVVEPEPPARARYVVAITSGTAPILSSWASGASLLGRWHLDVPRPDDLTLYRDPWQIAAYLLEGPQLSLRGWRVDAAGRRFATPASRVIVFRFPPGGFMLHFSGRARGPVGFLLGSGTATEWDGRGDTYDFDVPRASARPGPAGWLNVLPECEDVTAVGPWLRAAAFGGVRHVLLRPRALTKRLSSAPCYDRILDSCGPTRAGTLSTLTLLMRVRSTSTTVRRCVPKDLPWTASCSRCGSCGAAEGLHHPVARAHDPVRPALGFRLQQPPAAGLDDLLHLGRGHRVHLHQRPLPPLPPAVEADEAQSRRTRCMRRMAAAEAGPRRRKCGRRAGRGAPCARVAALHVAGDAHGGRTALLEPRHAFLDEVQLQKVVAAFARRREPQLQAQLLARPQIGRATRRAGRRAPARRRLRSSHRFATWTWPAPSGPAREGQLWGEAFWIRAFTGNSSRGFSERDAPVTMRARNASSGSGPSAAVRALPEERSGPACCGIWNTSAPPGASTRSSSAR